MKAVSDLIARKEYLPMPEDVQQELVEIYGERRIEKDSLIKKFATGMIEGAISAPISVLGIPSVVASAAHRKVRTFQVLNNDDGISKILVKHKHENNPNKPRGNDPGFFTYMTGVAITGLGILLSETPIGPILIGVGAGLLGTGVSIAGEAKAEQSRNRNRRE